MTLDDDVAAGLRRETRRTGRPLRSIVNDALRIGLERSESAPPAPFQIVARPLGLRSGIELDDIEGLLDRLDGPRRR